MRNICVLALLLIMVMAGRALAQPDNSRYVVFVHAGPNLNDARLSPTIREITGAIFKRGYLVRAPDNDQDFVWGCGS